MVLDLLAHIWTLVLFSLVVSAFTFPLVFILGFVYDYLCERFEKTPKIVWMLVCTFLGVLVAAILLELYLGLTIASLVGTASAA